MKVSLDLRILKARITKYLRAVLFLAFELINNTSRFAADVEQCVCPLVFVSRFRPSFPSALPAAIVQKRAKTERKTSAGYSYRRLGRKLL
jgi:hypothetical protein